MQIYNFSAQLGTGDEHHFADYRGKVLLIAASHRSTAVCRPFTNGFTRAALKSLLSHATSSATRSRGQTPRSPTSATRRMV